MSDYEYSEETYDSDASDASDATYTTEATQTTFSSFQHALENMMESLEQLDNGLDCIASSAQSLEQPITGIAIQSFTNPRVLESAPFRSTKFRLRHDAKLFLKTPHHKITFSGLCKTIRQAIRTRKVEVEEMWGTSEFLGILQKLSDIVE